MTRLLIGYDASEGARAAIAAAGALFPGAETVVAFVHPPPPSAEAGALARIALPDAAIRIGLERMRDDADRAARATVTEGVELAEAAGLRAAPSILAGLSAWRLLRDAARDHAVDALACGTRGGSAVDRVLLGSTASSLLYHTDRPLLVVPGGVETLDGPVYACYDGSDGARDALRFAGEHLAARRVLVAHGWHSPVRHSVRGHALAHSGIDTLEDYAATMDSIWAETAAEVAGEGTELAASLGLTAEAATPESARGDWQTLLQGAGDAGAAALLVGTRGRGAVASTVLGSVASGLVHAATLPVIVVPPINP